ncbi:MAG: discoidin domain-containing protein, partial [Phycisphaeraceae bacterium]|nr:discoidin domain-containing protein [Phycisphaeraceae bacterium]
MIDDVQIYNHALTEDEVLAAMTGLSKEVASDPVPALEQIDVLRDASLAWSSGEFAVKHDVYFGGSFDDVNTATVPTAAGLDVTSYDPGRLDFGTTYYWRVDEVNGTPDKTVFKGEVWSFTAEPYSILIPGGSVMVTASSSSNEFSTPDKSIDGSGLGEDGAHAIASEAMWFTAAVDLDPWIQFEFDGVKKLDIMKVWNSNGAAESAIGWGVKDVEIVYSVDGENWDVLEGATQISRAPGSPTYNTPDEIDFGGAAVKVVRLNIQSNWGGILMSYGLSEVQFNMIPAAARTLDPADGSVDVVPNALASWRAGRDAAQSTVYVSTDQNEVADGLAPSLTASTNSVDLGSLDLQLSETYYWRVDEVNNAEAIPVWAGSVSSFSTVDAVIVDDFESYNNISPDRPFQAWLDGFGYSADEFFPTAFGGNGTGAGIGHDIWSLSSPYYDGDIMETSNTLPGSGRSMPFYYGNSGGTASETQRKFAVPQDWTVGGAKILSIPFSGAAGNTGTLYAKINGTKVTYPRDASNLAMGGWLAFNIDLSGMNVQSVTELAIGVDGSNASGVLLIDDITLHSEPGEIITPSDPGTDGLVASYSFEGNANDVSGNGNNGTVNGGAQFVTGHDGSALDCDGIDDYVSTDKVASQLGIGGNSPRTISSWVFTRSYNNGGIYDVGARVAGQDFCLRTLGNNNEWRIQY